MTNNLNYFKCIDKMRIMPYHVVSCRPPLQSILLKNRVNFLSLSHSLDMETDG